MGHCEEYLERVSAAVDGALSPSEQAELEAHLASCPQCLALYRDLTALHDGMLDLPAVAVPPELTERIMSAVEEAKVVTFPAKKRNPWKKWLASAAVLAVVIAAGQGGRFGSSSTSADVAAPQMMEAAPAEGLPKPDLESGVTVSSGGVGTQSRAVVGDAPAVPENAQPATTSLDEMEQPVAQSISGAESAPIEPQDGSDSISYGNASEMPAVAREVDSSSEEGTIFTADDALNALLAEFPHPGCESWEVENIPVGWRSPNLAEEDAAPHWLEYVSDDRGYTFELQTVGEESDTLCLSRFTVFSDGTISVTRP